MCSEFIQGGNCAGGKELSCSIYMLNAKLMKFAKKRMKEK